QNPIFAGKPFRYPFAPDFTSALLVGGGWSIPAALIWPSWALTVLALSGLILWARRLADGIAAGVIAVTLTLLGGGVGFWFFFGDAARLGLVTTLLHIPQTYDRFDPPVNIQWYNPILSYYLPQRSFVLGAAGLDRLLCRHGAARRAPPADGGAGRPRGAAGTSVSALVDRLDVGKRPAALVLGQEHRALHPAPAACAAEPAGPPGTGSTADR